MFGAKSIRRDLRGFAFACCLMVATGFAAEQDSRQAASTPVDQAKSGVRVFHDRVVTFVDAQLNVLRDQGAWKGEPIAVVFLGITDRWEDAWALTQNNFRRGEHVVVAPTYDLPLRAMDFPGTAADHLRTALPRTPVTTRKIGLPELMGHLAARDVQVRALAFDSGGNFVLQENVADLIRYQNDASRRPEATTPSLRIVVNSGAVSELAHAKPLRDAGIEFMQTGERALVTALTQRFADFDPTGLRLPGLGVPGYMLNVASQLGRPFGEEGAHGYAAFRDEVNKCLADAAAYNVLVQGVTSTEARTSSELVSRTLDEMQARLERQRKITAELDKALARLDREAGRRGSFPRTPMQSDREAAIHQALDKEQGRLDHQRIASQLPDQIEAEQTRIRTAPEQRNLLGFSQPCTEETARQVLGVSRDDVRVVYESSGWVQKQVGKTRWNTIGRKGGNEAFLLYDATGQREIDAVKTIKRTLARIQKREGKTGMVLVGNPESAEYQRLKATVDADADLYVAGEVDSRGKARDDIAAATEAAIRRTGASAAIAVAGDTRERHPDSGGVGVDDTPERVTDLTTDKIPGGWRVLFWVKGIPVWVVILDDDGNIICQGPPGTCDEVEATMIGRAPPRLRRTVTDWRRRDPVLFWPYRASSMDRLARLGIRFANAYAVNPLCSPRRATVLAAHYRVQPDASALAAEYWANGHALLLATSPRVLSRLAFSTGYLRAGDTGVEVSQMTLTRGFGEGRGTLPHVSASVWAQRRAENTLRLAFGPAVSLGHTDPSVVWLPHRGQSAPFPALAEAPARFFFVSTPADNNSDPELKDDQAIVDLAAPDGAQVTVNGQDRGTQRRFTFDAAALRMSSEYLVKVQLPGGQLTQRAVKLSGGAALRLAVITSDEQTGSWQLVVCVPASAPLRNEVLQLLERRQYEQALRAEPGSARVRMERANDRFDKDAYDKAIADYERVVEIDQDCVPAHRRLADIYEKKGDRTKVRGHSNIAAYTDFIGRFPTDALGYFRRGFGWELLAATAKATAEYERAVKMGQDVNWEQVHLYCADVWQDLGAQEKAAAAYGRAKEAAEKASREETKAHTPAPKKPTKDEAIEFHNRGVAWLEKGELDKALADFDKALEIDPKYVYAYNGRGWTWYQKREYDKAIADYTKAIELDPGYKFAYRNRGWLWLKTGELDKALADFDKALEIDPKYVDAYNGRGWTWYRKREYDKAIADCTKAIELDPGYKFAYCNRAEAWREKGEFEKALADSEKAIQLDPKWAWAYEQRAWVWIKKDDFAKALAGCQDFIAAAPNDPEAYLLRDLVYHEFDRNDEAIADAEKAIEMAPKLPAGYTCRGNAYHGKGDFDRAIADYERAMELDPKNAGLFVLRANARNGKGQYDKAIADAERAAEFGLTSAGRCEVLGNAWSGKGDYDKAIAEYDKALELDPKSVRAYAGRGAAWSRKGAPAKAIAD